MAGTEIGTIAWEALEEGKSSGVASWICRGLDVFGSESLGLDF